MTDTTITCPTCHTEIHLTESLAAPLIEAARQQFEVKLQEKDAEVVRREQEIQTKERQVADAKRTLEQQVAEQVEQQLRTERSRVVADEARKAKLAVADQLEEKGRELTELQGVLVQRDGKLAEAQKAQADLLRKQRELDDAQRELELTVEKRVQASLTTVRTQAKQDAEESLLLKVEEKEQTIKSMQHTIEELKRKSEQGSQQTQGEAPELLLEALLTAKFPLDTVEPVAKGKAGADALQRVTGPNGLPCGSILWESKSTKTWSKGWLVKLRDDQRSAKADVAILVSQALPKEVETFDFVDDVWVAHTRFAFPLAVALRETLIRVGAARQVNQGLQSKSELVYQYLTGANFRQRVEAIVEAFSTMQKDLNAEQIAIKKQWAKREKQIERVMNATVGMYGDLQGIAGQSIQEIEGLELPALALPREVSNEHVA